MNEERDIEISQLRDEISTLLADALRVASETRSETERVQHAHDDELADMGKAHNSEMANAQRVYDEDLEQLQLLHNGEMAALRHTSDDNVANMRAALESRDVIGQAKGVIMVTMQCTADKAFQLLVAQSQAENRKLVEVAAEVAGRTSRAAQPPQD